MNAKVDRPNSEKNKNFREMRVVIESSGGSLKETVPTHCVTIQTLTNELSLFFTSLSVYIKMETRDEFANFPYMNVVAAQPLFMVCFVFSWHTQTSAKAVE